ncbi:MAG TPA: hypothetical protein VK469_14185 [Candidatus Kapabacteria bacterium]|nr:hypothetical protein [Candidatus Kapabacteria bacterium]
MKKSIAFFVLVSLVILCLVAEESFAQEKSPYEKYISATDIANVTGITGLKLIPRDPSKGAGGVLRHIL